MGPTVTRPVQDPLAVLSLDNRLHMSRVGFKPPLVDDTFYEVDALPTKPPRLDEYLVLLLDPNIQYLDPIIHYIISVMCHK